MSQILTLDQKKKRLAECESDMNSHHFGYRQFEERSIEIAVDRLYEALEFHSFQNYYKAKWPEAEKASSRKYQLLKYAEVVGNIANSLLGGIKNNYTTEPTIPLPDSERQTRPLASLSPDDQSAAWALSVEANNGNVPNGTQVAAVVRELQPARIDFVDTEPTPNPQQRQSQALPNMNQPPRHRRGWLERMEVDGKDFICTAFKPPYYRKGATELTKEHFPVAVQLWKVQVALEDAGLVVLPKHDVDGLKKALAAACEAAEEEDDDTEAKPGLSDDSADSDLLAERPLARRPTHAGIPGSGSGAHGSDTPARESPKRSGITTQVIKPLDFFGDDSQEEPLQPSFTAGMDFSDIDALSDGTFQDYPHMIDTAGKQAEETEANYFAMCLLIPEKFIRKDLLEIGGIDLADDTAVTKLAERYQVSVSLMILRCTEIMDRDADFKEQLRRTHR